MKNLLISVLAILIFGNLNGQSSDAFLTDVNIVIYSPNFAKSKAIAEAFIQEDAKQINNLTQREDRLTAVFYVDIVNYRKLEELLPKLGYLQEKIIKTNNFENKISELESEIKYLQEQKTAYENEVKTMQEKDNRYYDYWNEIRNFEKRIFRLEKDLNGYRQDQLYRIDLNVYDDQVDLTDRNVNWVNMPGASFDMLFIETPAPGITTDQYMGYSLKYMITRGKTHFTLGTLKDYSGKNKTDSTLFKEFFHFGFGQDFYTKHFGRGKRTWFNLYTGYNAGGLFATADNRKTTLPYIKAFFGLELFKNRYFLIDNKIGYYVPFKYNRNMRGLEYSFSFNFVF
jgi:hypothetical protein